MNKFFTKIFEVKIFTLLLIFLSVASLLLCFINNYILTYNDAASHLNIARRIVDNLTPGIAQIGTVWLPLPHILMLPFAIINPLWRTGIAGSIISMSAYIISGIALYKLIYIITENKVGAFLGTLVLALNPNLLYLQTTPMTEPILLATLILSIYYLAKYLKRNEIKDLILTGIFTSLATLTRYDGWFMFVCLCIILPFWVLKLHGRKQTESSIILYIVSGGFGIFSWLLWNLSIFGDALYFLRGPYSAYAQQLILKHVGQLPTDGNIFLSIYYYLWSVIDNNGILLVVSAGLGFLLVPFLIKQKKYLLIPITIAMPIVFNTLALYAGQSAMNIPQAPTNPGLFNIRYGLMALPAIAFVLGIVSTNRYLRILVIIFLFAQSVIFFQMGMPVSLADGINGLSQTYYTVESSKWLRDNYKGGLILTSLASNDAFVARAGIPMKLYVHEGTREHWINSLKYPSQNVEYIATLTFPPDSVYKKIKNNKDFLNNFVLVHEFKTFKIYEKKK